MKKIFISLIIILGMSCLHAMEQDEPIAYPLDLITTLTTHTTTLFRQDVEHTLINDIVKLKTWGSPHQIIQCFNHQGPECVIETKLKYDIEAEILNAQTQKDHHDVYVAFEVKELLQNKIGPLLRTQQQTSSIATELSLYKKDRLHFSVPKDAGANLTANLLTTIGVLNLNVAVSSFPATNPVYEISRPVIKPLRDYDQE